MPIALQYTPVDLVGRYAEAAGYGNFAQAQAAQAQQSAMQQAALQLDAARLAEQSRQFNASLQNDWARNLFADQVAQRNYQQQRKDSLSDLESARAWELGPKRDAALATMEAEYAARDKYARSMSDLELDADSRRVAADYQRRLDRLEEYNRSGVLAPESYQDAKRKLNEAFVGVPLMTKTSLTDYFGGTEALAAMGGTAVPGGKAVRFDDRIMFQTPDGNFDSVPVKAPPPKPSWIDSGNGDMVYGFHSSDGKFTELSRVDSMATSLQRYIDTNAEKWSSEFSALQADPEMADRYPDLQSFQKERIAAWHETQQAVRLLRAQEGFAREAPQLLQQAQATLRPDQVGDYMDERWREYAARFGVQLDQPPGERAGNQPPVNVPQQINFDAVRSALVSTEGGEAARAFQIAIQDSLRRYGERGLMPELENPNSTDPDILRIREAMQKYIDSVRR